ncbi:c-type cytochrome [Aquimarina sp. W85]|uniref:c-type cytochrome n=1 Tax=Aquimarina rhodophyticola TaxID=3342246 RepID=UPI00367104A4
MITNHKVMLSMNVKITFAIIISSLIFCACQTDKKEAKPITIGKKTTSSNSFDRGKEIFMGKGKCYTCHLTDKKSIGPSVQQIMKVYTEQQGDLISFLKQKAAPIVEPENYAVMKTNFVIIKQFSEEDLSDIEVYMNKVSTSSSNP